MPWEIKQNHAGHLKYENEKWATYLENLLKISLPALNEHLKGSTNGPFKPFKLAFLDKRNPIVNQLALSTNARKYLDNPNHFKDKIDKVITTFNLKNLRDTSFNPEVNKVAILYRENSALKASFGKSKHWRYIFGEVDSYISDLVFNWEGADFLQHTSPVSWNTHISLSANVKNRKTELRPIYRVTHDHGEAYLLFDQSKNWYIDENNPFVYYPENKETEQGKFACYIDDGDGQPLHPLFLDAEKVGGGGGGGAARSDSVDEVEYIWLGNEPLGYALGLEKPRLRKIVNLKVKKVDLNNGIRTEITIEDLLDNNKRYIVTNVPTGLTLTEPVCEIIYAKSFKDYRRDGSFGPDSKSKKKNKPFENLRSNMIIKDPYLQKIHSHLEDREGWIKKQDKHLMHRNRIKRQTASTEMHYSAGLVAEAVLKDGDAKKFWTKNVHASNDRIVTDQEWCHLIGHGDGGDEKWKNFVAGSKHCNTEQLAIESGQRKGKPQNIEAWVEAYLVPYENIPEDLPIDIGEKVWPLAAFMKYQLVDTKEGSKELFFSHTYDAQSYSFNYHEFKILRTTVERCIALRQDQMDVYVEGINARLKMHSEYKNLVYKFNLKTIFDLARFINKDLIPQGQGDRKR